MDLAKTASLILIAKKAKHPQGRRPNSWKWEKSRERGGIMESISKRYIVDEQNKKIAVQIPIDTFEKIEEILENYALVQLMKENENEEVFGVREAKAYYDQLEKAP
jgi:hypothetical protein